VCVCVCVCVCVSYIYVYIYIYTYSYSFVFHIILGINGDYLPIILCNRHAVFSVMKKLNFLF